MSWQRLSPRMLAVHPVQEVIRFLPVLLGVLVIGRNGHGPVWSLIGLGIAVGGGLLRWFTTSYQVTPTHIRVRRGLLNRRELSVPRDRVRSVDLTARPLQRVLGLSRVVIGTGRSDRHAEGVTLDALATPQAARLREELLHRSPVAQPSLTGPESAGPGESRAGSAAGTVRATLAQPESPGRSFAAEGWPARSEQAAVHDRPARPELAAADMGPGGSQLTGVHDRAAGSTQTSVEAHTAGSELARLAPTWIRFGPFTLSGIATIGVVAGSLANLVNETHLNPAEYGLLNSVVGQLTSVPVAVAVLEITVVAAMLVAVLSSCAYLLAFWNFRLVRDDGTLRVTRGLLTARSTTIETRRLRGAEISEPLLLRAVGGARCQAITTGLRARGAEHGGSILLPPAPIGEARRVAAEVIGEVAPTTAELVHHGPRARRRRHTRAVLFAVVVSGLPALLWWLADWPAWPWQVALALFPIGALLAEDRYRNLGHALVGRRLVFGQGSLVRRRYMVSSDGVIGWVLHRSFLQRRAGLASLTATTAAGRQHYTSPDMPTAAAVALADEALPGLLEPFRVRRQ